MKNSEAYKLAQLAVITAAAIAPENKLEILKLLLDDERLERFREEQNEKKTAVDE